ncbi:hypothetical protein F4560_003339 [Saccharothrix ecbatanensis]|uniref:Pentapeptide repeat protein n=1 Tax=Saccharothrix ecbatanensis TaxID=1105145 RepID=A0A7W9HKD5_9PSEU|nr:pentapeptide repeat-containing protein [Saccharothrix ecbatanensis]MBB5803571.1 hypothetical protein [Saccharothrix ecbatanensis]
MSRGALWRGGLVVIAFLVVVVFVAALVPQWLHPPLGETALRGVVDAEKRIQLQQAQGQLQNSVRSTLLQAVGGLLVLVGAAAAWRQVQVSREGQITERFTRAIDQLGSDNLDVRVGGIYALERIARNSPADRNTVQFVLGVFVRNHAPWGVDEPRKSRPADGVVDERLPWLQRRMPDIQAVMVVLSRRPEAAGSPALILSRVDLRSLLLPRGAQLARTVFRHTNLARAWLAGADLRHADLTGADLRKANLEDADLRNAVLHHTSLVGANLVGANLSDADLRGADLRETTLDPASLQGIRADATTRWPTGSAIKTRHDAEDGSTV